MYIPRCIRYESELKEIEINSKRYLFLKDHSINQYEDEEDGQPYIVRCCVEHFIIQGVKKNV